MARARKTNRKGTRPRTGIALFGASEFASTDEQWLGLEKAIGRSIPDGVRRRICNATSKYIFEAQAEENALYVDDYEKRLSDIEEHATSLRALLFHGAAQIDIQAATAALRSLDESHENSDSDATAESIVSAPYIETEATALESALERVALNCRMEIRRQDKPGFIEHEAWDRWISALLSILRAAGLPHGIATPTDASINASPAVRFIDAIQRLLPIQSRRHDASLAALARAMMQARDKHQPIKKKRTTKKKRAMSTV
jgi:hypothetical protein